MLVVYFIFIQVLIEHSSSEQWRPDQMPHSGLGLHYLSMSHKKDARLIWVNIRKRKTDSKQQTANNNQKPTQNSKTKPNQNKKNTHTKTTTNPTPPPPQKKKTKKKKNKNKNTTTQKNNNTMGNSIKAEYIYICSKRLLVL